MFSCRSKEVIARSSAWGWLFVVEDCEVPIPRHVSPPTAIKSSPIKSEEEKFSSLLDALLGNLRECIARLLFLHTWGGVREADINCRDGEARWG